MIFLTKKDAEATRFLMNYHIIERIEERGNTILFLENGKTLHVDESAQEIQDLIIEFEAKVLAHMHLKKDTQN